MENIGEKIYGLRKVKGISQEKLAEMVGVSRQTVYKWEADMVQPSRTNTKALCKAFTVEESYFYGTLSEEAKTKDETDHTEKRYRRSKAAIIAFLVLFSVAFFALLVAVVYFGLIVFDESMNNDYILTMNDVNPKLFYYFIASLVITLIVDLILVFLLIKKIRNKCKPDVN